jgi:hypothetical protein
MKGLRPADMVVVSLLGAVRMPNPVVLAKPGASYDWRWVRGLDVCLYPRDEDDWPDTPKAIALARPVHLDPWNPSGKWGAKV